MMIQNDRTLGKTGSDLLTEITYLGKRVFAFDDTGKTTAILVRDYASCYRYL